MVSRLAKANSIFGISRVDGDAIPMWDVCDFSSLLLFAHQIYRKHNPDW